MKVISFHSPLIYMYGLPGYQPPLVHTYNSVVFSARTPVSTNPMVRVSELLRALLIVRPSVIVMLPVSVAIVKTFRVTLSEIATLDVSDALRVTVMVGIPSVIVRDAVSLRFRNTATVDVSEIIREPVSEAVTVLAIAEVSLIDSAAVSDAVTKRV